MTIIYSLTSIEQRLDALLQTQSSGILSERAHFLQSKDNEPTSQNLTPGHPLKMADGRVGYVMCYLDKKDLYIVAHKTPRAVMSYWNSRVDDSSLFWSMLKREEIENLSPANMDKFDSTSTEFKECVKTFMNLYNE